MATDQTQKPNRLPPDWRKLAWDALAILATPLILVYLLIRFLRGKSLRGFAERLGNVPPGARHLGRPDEPVIWIHACSAGEVGAAEPIIRELRQAEPHAHLVLSTITTTGRAVADSGRLEVDAVLYFPLDFPGISEHVLDVIAPRLVVIAETELWPNFLAAASQRGIPVCTVNGRLSDKHFPHYRLIRFLTPWILSHLELICVQTEIDVQRFRELGADPDRVVVAGNSKFDEDFPQVPPEESAKWRQDLGFSQDQPILLAASTHANEEEIVLKCYERLRPAHPDLGLLIAPRHPERGDAVEALIGEFGYGCRRRTKLLAGAEPEASTDARAQVTLLDTMGEQGRVYSIATVVFMGGSLAPIGGHNILQPMAFGKPVIMGPHMHNQRELTEMALREGAVLQVGNPEEFYETVDRLLASESERELLSVKGQAIIARNVGAAKKMGDRIVAILDRYPDAPPSPPAYPG